MQKYLFVYHSGPPQAPPPDRQAIMAKWMAWFDSMGAGMADGGSPVGKSTTVSASDVLDHGGPNPVSGYGFFHADTLDDAIAMAKGCPIVAEGGTVEIAPVMQV
jgi:hypothetical protein